jgi:hypothetical protein
VHRCVTKKLVLVSEPDSKFIRLAVMFSTVSVRDSIESSLFSYLQATWRF